VPVESITLSGSLLKHLRKKVLKKKLIQRNVQNTKKINKYLKKKKEKQSLKYDYPKGLDNNTEKLTKAKCPFGSTKHNVR